MKVIELQTALGLENLRLSERPEPVPGRGEVRVRIRAASLNFRDLLMVRGEYYPKLRLPLIPCSDAAGVVEATGPEVRRFSCGDRVIPLFCQNWISGPLTREVLRSTLGGPLDGTLAESAVFPEESLVAAPSHLSFEEAAALPCAALAAWNALNRGENLQPGDFVLTMGSGGVSVFALQLARALGLEVITISGSDEKLQRLLSLGAAHGINYRESPEWGKQVRQQAAGEGVHLVVEVGGAGTLTESLKAVRPNGQISLVGVLSGKTADLNVTPVFMYQIRIQGIFVGNREDFESLLRFVAEHRLRPVVDRVFPLEEAPAAFHYLADSRHFGKVCVQV